MKKNKNILKIWKKKKVRKAVYQKHFKSLSNIKILASINEAGLILSKYDGIIKASGLQNAKLGELVFYQTFFNLFLN